MDNRNSIKSEIQNYVDEIESLQKKLSQQVNLTIMIAGGTKFGFIKRSKRIKKDFICLSVDGKVARWHWRKCPRVSR
jgi:hypothetical protein